MHGEMCFRVEMCLTLVDPQGKRVNTQQIT